MKRAASALFLIAITALPTFGQSVVDVFDFSASSGTPPRTGVTLDANGFLYGGTQTGGVDNDGTLFQFSPTSGYSTVFSFSGTNGSQPFGGLTADSAGNLYGTTSGGGADSSGVVFKLSATGVYTVLHTFSGIDGSALLSSLTLDSAGDIFGAASSGGTIHLGSVFEISAAGAFSVLADFNGADGITPSSNVELGPDGSIYGMTRAGGASNKGEVYKIAPGGAVSVLHSFAGSDGSAPNGNLILAPDGNLYGTTSAGGANNDGAIFKLSTSGTTYAVLHSFATLTDGSTPGPLVLGNDGRFYGTTTSGGANLDGVVYAMTPFGAFTNVYNFTGKPDGASPTGSLAVTPSGLIYGATLSGGANGDGMLFSFHEIGPVITPPPTTTISLAGPEAPSGEFSGSVTVTLLSIDPDVVATFFSLDGGSLTQYTSPFGVQGDIVHTVIYYSVDWANNQETPKVATFVIDTIPPVTTASLSGTMGNAGWYVSPVTVTLTATDNIGPFTTFYTVDGASNQTYSAPFIVSAQGSHVVTYWSVDGAGNVEASHTVDFEIDSLAPVITFGSLTPLPNAAGWNNSAVSVPFTAVDSGSGIASVNLGSPLQFSAEGANQTLTVTAVDVAGNSASLTSPAVSIDLTPPVTTASVTGATVTLSATDNLSGVASTFYTVDGGPAQTYNAPFTVANTGTHVVNYWSVDVAGNQETAKTVNVVIAPPVTAISLSGSAGNNGWYLGPVTVTLTATDAITPISTFYTVDGGATQTYSSAFVISPDGVHVVTYWSSAGIGNVETAHTANVDIDSTPPQITFGAPSPAPNAAGWNNTTVAIPYTAVDSGSGVASSTPSSPVQITTEGAGQTVTVTATDVAGNSSTQVSPAVNIDLTPPVTTASVSSATVTLSATDNLSGVASTFYTVDGGPTQSYTAPFAVSGTGTHTVNYWSVDIAGNQEAANSTTVTIASPNTSVALSGAFGTNGWFVGPVTVTLTGTSAIGPVTTFYTVDGGAAQTYTAPFVITAQGLHVVGYWSVGGAGNVEVVNTVDVNIDSVAPKITFGAPSPAPNAAGWNDTAVAIPYTAVDSGSGLESASPASPVQIATQGAGQTVTVTATDFAGNSSTQASPAVNIDLTPPSTTASVSGATVTLSATDNLSGVASTSYTVDGGTTQTYASSFTVTGAGTHTVSYWSTDVAGNVESAQSLTVTIASQGLTLTSMTPDSLNVFSPGAYVTLTGTGFQNGALVSFGSFFLNETEFDSSTQLRIFVWPIELLFSDPSTPVRVINPNGQKSNALTFTIDEPCWWW